MYLMIEINTFEIMNLTRNDLDVTNIN